MPKKSVRNFIMCQGPLW